MKRLTAALLAGLLAFSAALADAPEPKLRVLILDGQNNHDWRSTTPFLKKALEESGRFTVAVSSNLRKGEKPDGKFAVPLPMDPRVVAGAEPTGRTDRRPE